MPHEDTGEGLSAIFGAPAGCDAALGGAGSPRVPGVRGPLGAGGVVAASAVPACPTRPRGPASAARTRMSSVLSGRRAGATMPPRDIALITPPGYRPPPGLSHEPYVYKSRGRTLTLCTGTKAVCLRMRRVHLPAHAPGGRARRPTVHVAGRGAARRAPPGDRRRSERVPARRGSGHGPSEPDASPSTPGHGSRRTPAPPAPRGRRAGADVGASPPATRAGLNPHAPVPAQVRPARGTGAAEPPRHPVPPAGPRAAGHGGGRGSAVRGFRTRAQIRRHGTRQPAAPGTAGKPAREQTRVRRRRRQAQAQIRPRRDTGADGPPRHPAPPADPRGSERGLARRGSRKWAWGRAPGS